MILTIHVDGEQLSVQYPPFKVTEAIDFQAKVGEHPSQFLRLVDERDPQALRWLVWWARKRNGDEVPFAGVDFDLTSFVLEVGYTEEEQARMDARAADVDERVPTSSATEGGNPPT
jgi:hypothetical protein